MFLAVIFIVLGLYLLLSALGIIAGGNFWGIVGAVILLAVGCKLMMKRGKCPICGFHYWEGKMHGKIHDKMHGECCGHEHDEHGRE